jgi:ferrous iron transport protein B
MQSSKFLLVGSPNSGKTTLFNALTGLHQKTANYPGVTVEKFYGEFHFQNKHIQLIDLPGIYSLYSTAEDEKLAIQEILHSAYDGIILVVNAHQFEKNLLLILQILELKKPTILVLNMIDEAQKNNIQFDISALKNLFNVEIVATNARTKQGIQDLLEKLSSIKESTSSFYDFNLLKNYHHLIPESINNYEDWLKYYHSESNLEKLQVIVDADLNYKKNIQQYILNKCVSKSNVVKNNLKSFDKYLTHKFYGFVFLLITLLITFQLVFFIAEYPMEWLEWIMNNVTIYLKSILPDSELANLIVDGILPGITGVLIFIPQIAVLFLVIGILEESGYMARISFLLDSIFNKFGLSGKSLIPLVSGVACAVPSILSTRTITNPKEKLITILVLPFMSCSARLPVYTLLISLIFPENETFLFFNIKGLVLFALYLFGLLMALIYAWIFHKIIHQNKKTFFFIELPSYKLPHWKNLMIIVWNKVKIFITDAGKIIVAISIILWYLSTHTFSSIQNNLNNKYSERFDNDSINIAYKRELLENSYIGLIGKKIEPIIAQLGYDWKIGISLLTSFAAREVFVGTMATLYSSASEDDIISLREKIATAKHSDTNTPVFTTATNVSLLIYYALAMQCISTMVVVYRELKSLKWMIIQFLIMTGTAYLLSFLAYTLISS